MSNSSESSIFSVKCTNCAAPLKILGGGRVTTVTCEYCNSVLDMQDNYRVLSQFHHKYRPPVPLTLGMQGKIKGVEWTIIGWIAYKTVSFPIERWSEFFLYSELYGYGWLNYEEGNFSFSKRVRDFPLREWQDKGAPGTVFYQRGHFVKAEDPYSMEIDFVQGELSWIAKANDRVRCWDYNGVNRKSLSIEKTNSEIEVYLNEKLNSKEVYDSFKVNEEDRVKPKRSFTQQVFTEDDTDSSEEALGIFTKGMLALFVMLLFAIAISFVSDKSLLKNHTDRPFNEMITIDSNAFLATIELKAPSPAALNEYRLTLYQSDKKILSIDKYDLFSTNPHLRSTWLAGDNEVTIYIKLPEGVYRASLERLSSGKAAQKITVTIKERVVRLLYILPLALLIFIVLLPAFKEHILPQKYQKYFWLGLVAAIGFAIFGSIVILFVGAFFYLVKPTMDANSNREDD